MTKKIKIKIYLTVSPMKLPIESQGETCDSRDESRVEIVLIFSLDIVGGQRLNFTNSTQGEDFKKLGLLLLIQVLKNV